MKKYSKPTMKIHAVKTSAILTGSNETYSINRGVSTSAEQLGKDRGGFFDDEEDLSW